MLQSLEIRDFALIEHLRVEWTQGLNVLTGETGAGKSILMDALNTVLGGKAGPSVIRSGAERAYIEAEFTLQPNVAAWLKQQQLIEEQSETFAICRDITKSGTRIRINGTLVNANLVQELAQILLTVHAQHEARTLMSPQAQLDMLDSLGEPGHKRELEKLRTVYARKRDLAAQLKELQMSEEERLRKLDFARYQLQELSEAALESPHEDEEIAAQQSILANVSALEQSANDACAFLSGNDSEDFKSAVDLVQNALIEVERGAKLDPTLEESQELIAGALSSLEEATRSLRRYANTLDANPEALANVEARLAQLASIKRKYGPTLQEAIDRCEALKEEVEKLDNAQSAIDELTLELGKTSEELQSLSSGVSATRSKMAKRLSEAVERELKDLGMERCRFEISFDQLAEPGPSGTDRIEFVIAPNPGQPLMSLGKIASGGELSRIMLAIKSIFASSDAVPTVIFDEIDTGLSGRVLQSMRDKLAKFARSHQILCITHQPIIASIADNHIEVQKEQSKTETKVSAKQLNSEEMLRSLAAMASGQGDQEIALTFARSLVDQANEIRGTL
ncbi:MAG TPA: DNA repair protein RecN [Planktothrix sp.]|jgi:DNA repair protein RecN (Recombination protein N)